MAEGRWGENEACIHTALFRSERIVGQERLFCSASYLFPFGKQQCLLCAPEQVTARGASRAIFGSFHQADIQAWIFLYCTSWWSHMEIHFCTRNDVFQKNILIGIIMQSSNMSRIVVAWLVVLNWKAVLQRHSFNILHLLRHLTVIL